MKQTRIEIKRLKISYKTNEREKNKIKQNQ